MGTKRQTLGIVSCCSVERFNELDLAFYKQIPTYVYTYILIYYAITEHRIPCVLDNMTSYFSDGFSSLFFKSLLLFCTYAQVPTSNEILTDLHIRQVIKLTNHFVQVVLSFILCFWRKVQQKYRYLLIRRGDRNVYELILK